METTFVRLEPRLIDAVVKVTGIRIKARAIRTAIEEFLRDRKRKGLKQLAGKLRFYTQHDLARMRNHA
ncbi:MAG: hypothetical protein HYV03_05060 [Deltaproteobacteria bacterium]|nr:hypothetical protein [Deltaproteobacteria bacterium]